MTDERTDSLSQASQTPHSDTKDNREIEDLLENKSFIHYSCGIDADPADGFGYCTCGTKEELKETAQSITQLTQSNLLDTLLEAMPEKWSEEGHDWMETVGQYDALTEVETIIKEMQK